MRTRHEIETQDQRIVTGAVLAQLREKLAVAANAVEFAKGRSSGDLERMTAAAWQKVVEAAEGALLTDPEPEGDRPLTNPDRKHGYFDQVIADAEAVSAHMTAVVEQAQICIDHGWYAEDVQNIDRRAVASREPLRRIEVNTYRADHVGDNLPDLKFHPNWPVESEATADEVLAAAYAERSRSALAALVADADGGRTMTAAFPHSVSTGHYTIEQLEGETCASCGRPFAIGEPSRPSERILRHQLFVHVKCLKVGASR